MVLHLLLFSSYLTVSSLAVLSLRAARCSALLQSHNPRSTEWTEKCLAKEEINQLIKLRSLNQGTSNSLPIAASQAQCNVTALWKS